MKMHIFLLTAGLSLTAAADDLYEVNYGVVESIAAIDTRLLEADKFGYTVKLLESNKLIQIESKVAGILLGDCVSLDTKDDESRIRRVANANCNIVFGRDSTGELDIAEVEREVERKIPVKTEVSKSTSDELRTPACERAIEKLNEAPMGSKRREARQVVAKVC